MKFKKWIAKRNGTISDRLYSRSEGEQTRGLVISPECKPIATAIFVHGTGNDLTYPSVHLFQALFQQNIKICTFDLDGHGHSSSSQYESTTVKTYLPWVFEQLELSPTEKVFVIGHSLGGSLALTQAVRDLHQIAGLILISAPVKLTANLKALKNELKVFLRKTLWQQIGIYGVWGLVPALGPFKRKTYPIRLRNNDVNYIHQVNKTIENLKLQTQLRSISCPVLLIYGTEDQIVQHDNAETIKNELPDCDLLLIEGATHFSTILEPQVPEKISSFIRDHAHG